MVQPRSDGDTQKGTLSSPSGPHARAGGGEVIGEDGATTLMEHVPPDGWADVATKRDLDALEASLKREIGSLEEAVKLDFGLQAAATRLDINDLRAATRHEVEGLAAAMEHGFGLQAEATRRREEQTEHRFGDLEASVGRVEELAVSTRQDPDNLAREVAQQGSSLRVEIAAFGERMHREMTNQAWKLVTVIIAIGGLAAAGVHL